MADNWEVLHQLAKKAIATKLKMAEDTLKWLTTERQEAFDKEKKQRKPETNQPVTKDGKLTRTSARIQGYTR